MPEGAFYGQELVKKRSFFINEYGNHCSKFGHVFRATLGIPNS